MKFNRKRAVAVATGAALTFIVGSVAFGYWTTTGAGSGTATAGNTSPITINSAAVSGLYPGATPTAVSGTFTNPNAGSVFVAQVTIAVDPAMSVGAVGPKCTAADFLVTQPAATGAQITTGSTWAGATIQLKNLGTNQDNCKGVTVPLLFTSN